MRVEKWLALFPPRSYPRLPQNLPSLDGFLPPRSPLHHIITITMSSVLIGVTWRPCTARRDRKSGFQESEGSRHAAKFPIKRLTERKDPKLQERRGRSYDDA